MGFLQSTLAYIVDLGSYIFVPILMMILGLIFGLKFLEAIKSGVTVGIGLIGVSIVGGLVADSLSPVIDAFVKRFNLNLSAIDIGGGPAAATGFGFSLSAIIILVIVTVNILLVAGKFTNTVNVDIYNFWYYCITAGFVYGLTKSVAFSIIAAVSHAVLGYVFADLNAKKTEEVIGIEGVSIPHGFAAASAPLFMLLDKIYDKIPFFNFRDENEDEYEEEKENKLFSIISTIFGDPLFLGLLMGLIFGISAQYDVKGVLDVSIKTAAILKLYPTMVNLIVQGLMPISGQAQAFFAKNFKGRTLSIGLDSAVTIGHTLTQSVGVVMIPIFMILAAILPGNRTLPLGEVPFAAFYVCFATIVHRANKRRTFVSGILFIPLVLWISTWAAPLFNQMSINQGLDLVSKNQQATTMALGNLFIFIPTKLASMKAIGVVLLLAIDAVALYINKQYLKKNNLI